MKVKTALSISLAFGLVAGTTTGLVAQDAEAGALAASFVTGTISYAPSCEDPTIGIREDGVTEARGYLCTPAC